jgi:hypothetical protein
VENRSNLKKIVNISWLCKSASFSIAGRKQMMTFLGIGIMGIFS